MYGANHRMMPTTRVLLDRVRAALDAMGEEPCPLTDDELVAQGLSLACREYGVSGHVCAADLPPAVPTPSAVVEP